MKRAKATSITAGLVIAICATVLAGISPVFATDPASNWNVPGQVRSHTCSPMQRASAPLRFPDGTPTGFYVYANDPSKNGSSTDCAIGTMEVDAQEILTNGAGLSLYFHPGGGPDLYTNYVDDGQYGHIAAGDFTIPPTLTPLNINGKPCSPAVPGADADFVVNQIGVAQDGAIYVGNLTSLSLPPQFVLYRWVDESSPQTVVFAGDPGNGNTNVLNQRWGDTLCVRGVGTNTQILIGSGGTLAAILRPTDAWMTAFTATTLTTDLPAGGMAGGLSYGAGNTFWAKQAGGTLSHVAFDLSAGSATTLYACDALQFPSAVSPLSVSVGSDLLAALDIVTGPDLVRVYNVADSNHAPALLDRRPFITANDNAARSGAVAFGSTNRLYALDSENGIMAFSLNPVSSNPLAPTIILQPVGQTVLAGSNLTLTAGADGTDPLFIQWKSSNHDLPGATGTNLTVSNAQPSNSGDYLVIITNAWGAVTSSVATVTVVSTIGAAGLLDYEPFIYGVGAPLAGEGDWTLSSGTSGTIQPGNLPVPGLAPAYGNHFGWTSASMSVRFPVGINIAGSLYFSFAFRLDQLAAGSSDTIAGFTTGTLTTFAPKINVVSNSTGFYNIGIYKSSGLTGGTFATNAFSTNDVVFVVARYTFNTNSTTDDTCDLWLNPSSATFGAATPPTPTLSAIGAGRTDLTQIDRFFFRSAGPALQCEADELRVGQNWASVTPLGAVRLTITHTSSGIALRWPTNTAGFGLEQKLDAGGSVWMPSPESVSVVGTNYVVPLSATNSARYYRLRR